MARKVTVYSADGSENEITVPDDDAARPHETLPPADPNVVRIDVNDA